MTEDAVLETAIALASQFHAGQLDKSGRPYVGHLKRVANMVRRSGGNWVQEAAAWLHDVIEDTEMTAEQLGRQVPGLVVRIVEAMIHPANEPNVEYWERLRAEPSAVLVKLCDIYDNLDPARMCYLDEVTQTRLRTKYARAMQVLVEVREL